uniref:Xylanolytic transcriptional activator regulatory domain-containing protein n=1 Tax=Kwoniella bestiolae CBS 10118 TaxID=1296100 RepID=A0A1B9FSE0_9TREE|nr:hypothetical protein I302_08447 [Kwoniella bestiolae CBS 10118]OCF21670.1 hypothetical protein I302_08447 [Kwoniella bestiolae CBS 10118]
MSLGTVGNTGETMPTQENSFTTLIKSRKTGRACDACNERKIKCNAASLGHCKKPVGTFNRLRRRRGPLPGYLKRLPKDSDTPPQGTDVSGSTTRIIEQPSLGVESTYIQPSVESLQLDDNGFPDFLSALHETTEQYEGIDHTTTNDLVKLSIDPLIPTHSSNPLDKIMNRDLLNNILDSFFDFVYPIFPLPHRPTFRHDLANKREEQTDQHEWTAMVLGLVAFTLVQVPHDMLDLTKEQARCLVVRCGDACRLVLSREFDNEVSVERLVLMYCIGTVANNRGKYVMARSLHGSSVVLALQKGLNQEATYYHMGIVEREMFRRLWWLIYVSDRSSTCTENGHFLIDEDLCADVNLPLSIDDDWITHTELLDQPADYTSIMCGFNYSCKAWRLAGQLLQRKRSMTNKSFTRVELLGNICEIDEMLVRVEQLMLDCPSCLKLDVKSGDSLAGHRLPIIGQSPPSLQSRHLRDMELHNILRELFAQNRVNENSYLVQQANIYVTQQLLRLMLLEHRETLVNMSIHTTSGNGTTCSLDNIVLTPNFATGISTMSTRRETVMEDLLQVLHTLPIEVHAINSLPGVTKIRFVVAALLLLGEPPSEEPAGGPNADHNVIWSVQLYLYEYIRILTMIEQLYSLQNNDEMAQELGETSTHLSDSVLVT